MSHYDAQYEKQMQEQYNYDVYVAARPRRYDEKTRRDRIKAILEEIAVDVMKVFDFGAEKHPDSGEIPNFLTENGNNCSLRDRGSSVLRHAARTFMNPSLRDDESLLPELLHLMASASILYIRTKRGIVHQEDKQENRYGR